MSNNLFDEARASSQNRLSEADRSRIEQLIKQQMEGQERVSSFTPFIEFRGTYCGGTTLVNACAGTRNSGGALPIEKIEANLTKIMETCLILAGMHPNWKEGVHGARSMGPSITLKGDAEGDDRVLSALGKALWMNRSVAFVTGTGALMCPVVQSQPPVTGADGINFGSAEHGNYTPIWALAEALCGTVSDLQMYFGSLMGARIKRGLDRGNYVPRCPVILWDFEKSIGVDAEGREVFLPDVDTDGGALASSGLLGAPGVQFRGFTLLEAEGVIWKGAMHEHPVRWSSDLLKPVTKASCTKEEWQAAIPCILMDANCPKGRAKAELLGVLEDNGFVLLPQQQTMLWCFSEWGVGDWYGADCIRLPLTFQDNVWLPADKKWKKEVKRSIWSLFRNRMQEIMGRDVPILDATRRRDAEKIISGSSLRKARQLRARANRFLPFGAVMVHEVVLKTPKELDRGEGPEFGKVAQGRAPTLQPHSKQCNLAFTREGLLRMLGGSAPEELNAVLERHNHRARWYYGSDAKDHILDRDAMLQRLRMLEVSTRGVNLRGSFLASQLDASCREEDQDGDTTVCESEPWWTERFGKAQSYWSDEQEGLGPFKNELSSEVKTSYSHPLVTQALGHLHVKGASPSAYREELFSRGNLAATWLKEALSDPQGPTGLFADLGSDLAARLPFFKDGKTAKQVVEENPQHFAAWSASALGCQISIDLAKKFILNWGFDLRVAEMLMKGDKPSKKLLEELFEEALAKDELDMGTLAWAPSEVNGKGSHGFCPEKPPVTPVSGEMIEEIIETEEYLSKCCSDAGEEVCSATPVAEGEVCEA